MKSEIDMLRDVVIEVLIWARTPGNHGGNPYGHNFMLLASEWQEKFNYDELNKGLCEPIKV